MPETSIILETERLLLCKLTLQDAGFILELVNTPGWLTYIGDRNIHTPEQAEMYLKNGPIKSYTEQGFGLWRVEVKESGIPVGMCGLLKRDYLEHPDIGFAFLPGYTGRGFGFEAVSATVTFAKDVLQLPAVLAITLPANTPSIRLLEKAEFHIIKPIYPPDGKEALMLFGC